MMKDKMYTNVQEEKIYVYNQIENEEETNKKLSEFFSELVKRRRNDALEEGLQASVVIFSDKCAMKICEDNGSGPHLNALVNLVKHLNNDFKYISLDGTGYYRISENERRELMENGIEIRILDSIEKLKLIISSNLKKLSQYQIDILNSILLCLNRKNYFIKK